MGWLEDVGLSKACESLHGGAFMAKVFWSNGEGDRTFRYGFSVALTEIGNSFGQCLDTVLEAPYLLALAYYTEKLF